ncbi:aspartyl-phosphate phosphatase Spo0E family protein [Anaerophilus nitritogenes]|uniref:aspartyl-phosphate phosphatase Spo0E family protein n=1 Tax=Anaerophilus nitritogenes TaxID=2498136 RepID=UPI00101C9EC2|nr:aspartyl-phosphate phosphatase Spo0E family protein [Anaerophilus nitritogenes]
MNKVKELKKQIAELRTTMHILINNKNDLLDYEVLSVSQQLDLLLNQYYDALSDIKNISHYKNRSF